MRIYLIIAIIALVGGAYIMGARVAREKCTADVANATTAEIINTVNNTRAADEKTFNTGVRDIRNILRAKYTIAD